MSLMSTENGISPYPKLSGAKLGSKRTDVVLSPQIGESKMKCLHCGLAKDENPSHAADYSGPGKHSFKTATKSEITLGDDSPIAFGTELKSLGGGRYGGWAIVYSDHENPDLTGDFFSKETDYFFEGEQKAIRPVLYDHGLDPTLKSRKIGKGTLEIKDAGVWFETQLDIADAYDKKYLPYIETMAKSGRLGISTGSAPHLIQREAVGKAMHIKSWPIVELSFTPKPIEPKTKKSVMALKSYAELEGDIESPFKGVVDEEDEEDRVHEFEPSDDDPGVCDVCDESFDGGNHASKKALESLKGGPGSGRRPGSGTADNHVPTGGHKEGDRVKVRGNGGRGAVGGEGKKGEIVSSHGSFHVVQFDKGGDASYHESDLHNLSGRKSLDRNFKGIFEEELAETGTSFYTLGQVLCETMKDIANAADTVDISGGSVDLRIKVTEAVTEYAARLIPMLVGQIQDWLDNGGLDSGNGLSYPSSGGNNQFYVKSFLADGDNPLQVFLNMKSTLVSGVRLDEHSSQVVSALSEYANETASLLEGVKAWIERCEEKIQFRTGDSTKSGRTISAATSRKLQEALDTLKNGSALHNELRDKLSALTAMAEPKKSADLRGLFTLMLAEHDTEMAGVPLTH